MVNKTLSDFNTIKNNIIHKYILNDSYELLNTTYNAKFNGNKKSINDYILLIGLKKFKELYSYIPITEYVIYDTIIPNNTFIVLKSKVSINHPYIVYANHYSNTLKIILSYGKDKKLGQFPLDDFEVLFSSQFKDLLSINEYYSIYILLLDSVHTRKLDMINNDRYSLLKCANIKQCSLVTRTLKKGNKGKYNSKEINSLILEKELYYKKKAVTILEKFFTMLDHGNFEDAYKFLKVDKVKKGTHKGKTITRTNYFGKQRLDTFFKANKKLIGHLQIFIDLYQFIHICITRINSLKL